MGEKRTESIAGIPTGTVTFFFTDVESSTKLWEEHPGEMRRALERHDSIVRSAIQDHDGYVFSLAGDQFVAAFHNVANAVSAARAIQSATDAEPWPDHAKIGVRIGIHVGVAEERDNDYFGPVLNRTARIVSAARAGQTLLSSAAAPLAGDVELTDLGENRLKDLTKAERLWQVGTEAFAPLRTLQAGRHNLPIERTPLIGRSDDTVAIARTVMDTRLVSLLGIGGTGKTRLAVAVAAELADQFEHGVWFVDLVPATDANSIAEAAASASGLQLAGGDLLDALAEQAANRELLLVFDNCEHVTDDAADVIDRLLERSPSVHVIVTSREPLELPDERQVRVSPLAVDESPDSPAISLFADAAQRVGFDVGPADVDIVAQICSHLDGLPLSIELAGAQLRQLTLVELADRLDQRFELLTRGSRRRRRHSSLFDVLNDSWTMLDDAEQGLLKKLAAFPSSFALADAEELSGSSSMTARTLGGLTDRGLVSSDGDGGNKLLETVKLFVRERWADDASADFANDHSTWVLTRLREHGADNNNLSMPLAGWAIRHYDDHRVVEDRFAAAGRYDELAELLQCLRWVYSRETPQRASALIERVERYLTTFDLTDWQAASLHLVAGRAARAARHAGWIKGGGERAVELFRTDGSSAALATALIGATFHEINHDPIKTYEMLDEAHDIASEVGAETLVAATLGYRANYLAMSARFDEAQMAIDELEARPGADSIDQVLVMKLEATMMVNLLDDPGRSLAAIQRCVDLAAAHGLDHDWFMLLHLASATAATGDTEATSRCLDQIDELLDQSGLTGLPDVLLPYLTLAYALGDESRCRRWLAAIRKGPGHLGTGISIAIYRIHRSAVGLAAPDSLDRQTIQQIHAEAQDWLQDLVGPISASPA